MHSTLQLNVVCSWEKVWEGCQGVAGCNCNGGEGVRWGWDSWLLASKTAIGEGGGS